MAAFDKFAVNTSRNSGKKGGREESRTYDKGNLENVG